MIRTVNELWLIHGKTQMVLPPRVHLGRYYLQLFWGLVTDNSFDVDDIIQERAFNLNMSWLFNIFYFTGFVGRQLNSNYRTVSTCITVCVCARARRCLYTCVYAVYACVLASVYMCSYTQLG